ncbi:hemin importer ATP-binding subunit [Serratia grimesii]|nr:hemin importer ATP-binding subunit [Serratia grimesii]CAI2408206.1 hemin importer ATP-binding subunit [Serratia grimesii]SUI35621.1 hemin importer ATP-binding subunit [Serratia grimesii]
MLNANKLLISQKDYFILVGKNGSGKSRLLHDLAESLHNSGYSTITVSNTLFDKFEVHPRSLNYNYIGSKLGRNFPAQAIKNTLSTESQKKVSRIFSVLNHIGYEQKIGIKIKFRKKFKDAIKYSRNASGDYYPIFFDSSDQEIPDELKMAIDKAIHQIKHGYSILAWLTSNDNVFYEGNFDSYLCLLKFERILKKSKIISNIDVFLSKDDHAFPLSQASSGELSFIALLVHISFCVNDRSFIFIDEPENSLHPKWQNEYLELLRGSIGYNKCMVVVATHSPLIITSMSEGNQVSIYKRGVNGFEKVNSYDENNEELYIDYFDTLTPKNRALSNRCVDIIDQFTVGEISLQTARDRLSKFGEMANNSAQKEFLSGVNSLITTVNFKKWKAHE